MAEGSVLMLLDSPQGDTRSRLRLRSRSRSAHCAWTSQGITIVTLMFLLFHCDVKTLLALLVWRYLRIARPPRILCLDAPGVARERSLTFIEHVLHHILLFVSPEEALNLAVSDRFFYGKVMDDETWWGDVFRQLWGDDTRGEYEWKESCSDRVGDPPELKYYFWWDLTEAVMWVIVCAGVDPALFSWYLLAAAVVSLLFDRSPLIALLRLSRLCVLVERMVHLSWRPFCQLTFLVLACAVAWTMQLTKPKLMFAHGPLDSAGLVASNPPKRFVFWSPFRFRWGSFGLKASRLVIVRRAFEYYGEREAALCHFIYEAAGDASLRGKALRDLRFVQGRLLALLRRLRVDIPDRARRETNVLACAAVCGLLPHMWQQWCIF
eukprot:GEMP01030428.1.p1 GENE.GEMP01030428.1~~GEMP01030428.1.p1  ORF type:complete len:379 (+),score=85.97 GEMP01030428.1:46-1182(+)